MPLDQASLRIIARTHFRNMHVTYTDADGKKITIQVPAGENLDALADAFADAMFEVLKTKVLIEVVGSCPTGAVIGTGVIQ